MSDSPALRGPALASWQLRRLANALDDAKRGGTKEDRPEGMRYIVISDTLARTIAARLNEIADEVELRGKAWAE
jgi:hypothetical protein